MPEGDTVYRTARTLERALAGQRITRFSAAFAELARQNDETPLAGQQITRVEAHGKWILMHLSGGLILVSHLRMNGSWHIYRPGEPWQRNRSQMRVLIETDAMVAVGFNLPLAEFTSTEKLGEILPALGPDLLRADFCAAETIARIRAQAGEQIGDVLLDQRVLAGVGNVFKSEICFVAGVHPFRIVETLREAELNALVEHSLRLLRLNVRENSNWRRITYAGFAGRSEWGASATHWVYGRTGKPCRRCGAPVRSRKQGAMARNTFWCPQCQLFGEGGDVEGWTGTGSGRR